MKWLNKLYGEYREVKATRGKIHDYLGMRLNFETRGKVKVDMTKYTEKMLSDFREHFKLDGTAKTPAGSDLFDVKSGELLDNATREVFHTFVAKGLFMCKRSRPDIQPTIAVLATRVREPTSNNWKKLLRLLKYINGTRSQILTLGANDMRTVKWYVDTSFAVHPDF